MQQWVYDILIAFYRAGISLACFFNEKARLWVKGRRDWETELRSALEGNALPVIWVHAASLGEFEQGRPIIERLREESSPVFILLTFFSPSGYEVRKDYDQVDHVMYIPLDTRRNAHRFLGLLSPDVAVFVKYEFWFNHLRVLRAMGSSVYLASGRFYPKQGFFQSWGAWLRKGLDSFDHFYVQDESSASLLESIGLKNYTVTGDTRFDRVIAIKEEAREIPKIKKFVGKGPCLIVGSSWPQEEARLLSFLNEFGSDGFKTIIAPHEISDARMSRFASDCRQKVARMSTWDQEEADVMFIDSIGMLAQCYRYGAVALVGGAFGEGLHNVLEPAVWSLPVLFGPRYTGFQEAVALVEIGAAQMVESQEDLDKVLMELLMNEKLRLEMGKAAGEFCFSQKGATEAIVEQIIKALEEKIISS